MHFYQIFILNFVYRLHSKASYHHSSSENETRQSWKDHFSCVQGGSRCFPSDLKRQMSISNFLIIIISWGSRSLRSRTNWKVYFILSWKSEKYYAVFFLSSAIVPAMYSALIILYHQQKRERPARHICRFP